MHNVYAHEHDMVTVDSNSMDSANASYIKHLNHLLCQITPTLDVHASQAELIARDTTLLLQHFHRLVATYAEKQQENFEIS